jgi:hypothetical protein
LEQEGCSTKTNDACVFEHYAYVPSSNNLTSRHANQDPQGEVLVPQGSSLRVEFEKLMTVKETIEALQHFPMDAQVGAYNPVFNETYYLVGFGVDDSTPNFVEVQMDSKPNNL